MYQYSKFPDKGDVLVVSYVYEPTLSKLVEADGYDFTVGFNTKAFKRPFSLSFHRHEHDPNYDKRMGGGGEFRRRCRVTSIRGHLVGQSTIGDARGRGDMTNA